MWCVECKLALFGRREGVSGGRGLVRGRGKEVKDYGINSSNKPAMIDHMRLISFGLLFETT